MNIQSRYWDKGKEDTLWGRVVVLCRTNLNRK